ncbi:hypothetical protein FPZ24_02875 [Sphingomonas panacisoli]|uniref:Uncharacterized protein n=1 Tax=Sphingomonas panacisoli TaxID=1813879 RepID=A0A5B8LFQ6_9SPHN|nr:hypothetical protein [Sphingomonas panacisoli]QDZ06544.1 hypothetical protein FPZ24_02875 [Sphingomonas panacisoli]
MRILIVVAVAMSFPTATLAQDAKPVDPNKKICRDLSETGSLFTKRVCNTQADWEKIDERDRKNAKAFDDYRSDNGAFRR